MFNGGRYGRYFDVANGGRHWKHWVFRVGRERAGHGSAGRRNNAEVRRVRRGAAITPDWCDWCGYWCGDEKSLNPLQTQEFRAKSRGRVSRNDSGGPPLFMLFYMQNMNNIHSYSSRPGSRTRCVITPVSNRVHRRDPRHRSPPISRRSYPG